MKDLREKIAKALGWTIEETKSFSFPSLREMVRARHPELAAEMSDVIAYGEHLIDRGDDHKRNRVPMPDMSWLGLPPPKEEIVKLPSGGFLDAPLVEMIERSLDTLRHAKIDPWDLQSWDHAGWDDADKDPLLSHAIGFVAGVAAAFDVTPRELCDAVTAIRVPSRKRLPCPKCGGKTHRCKTGTCRHCDICDHAFQPERI